MADDAKALRKVECALSNRYTRLTKVFLVLAVLCMLWVAIVALGIVFMDFGPAWAIVTLDTWIVFLSGVFALFIVVDLLLYMHYKIVRDKRIKAERPKPEFIDGKLVYEYTHPKGVEGGIFSKTYVTIDGHSVLRVRSMMVPPGELWVKEE